MSNEIQTYEAQASVINFEEYAMTRAGVMKQIKVIQEIMHGVMKLDEHYGTIPGTDNPSLYKAGAEKLSLTFRLRPEYDIRRSDLSNNHREYEIVCTLYHIPTGQSVGQGVGSASTMEGKYRFRPGPVNFTGKPVPKVYWNDRDNKHLGGRGFVAKKNDSGQWEIATQGEKVEHDNPADYYNTVLKMAKKRAHVDAILTATAASDIFTQDVEDMPEVIPGANKQATTPVTEPAKPPIKEPQRKSTPKSEAPKAETTTEPLNDVLFILCMIDRVEIKGGEKSDGSPYTIYAIYDTSNTKYGTFSDTLADLAASAKNDGKAVNISYTVGKYGNRIVTLEMTEA